MFGRPDLTGHRFTLGSVLVQRHMVTIRSRRSPEAGRAGQSASHDVDICVIYLKSWAIEQRLETPGFLDARIQ